MWQTHGRDVEKLQISETALDSRNYSDVLPSHDGIHLDAVAVREAKEIPRLVDPDTTVVAIDEGQFFNWTIADVCNFLADNGRRVIIAGLDMDFRGEPFGPVPLLMTQAEKVDKLQAICVVCGMPASRTQRLINSRPAFYDDPVMMVGANEVYEARCRHCHQVPRE